MFLHGVMKLKILARDKKGTLSSPFQRGGGYFLLRGEGSTNFDQEGEAPPLLPCPPVLKVFACQLLRELSLSLILLNSDFQFFRKTSTVAIKLYLWPQMSDLDNFWT